VSRLCDPRLLQTPAAPACALGLLLISFCGVAGAQGNSPTQLRQFIDQQVGGLNKLKVPATDAEIPVPRMPDGTVNPRYQTTEAKRFLGKMLFHDPIRTARININKGQPLDLPAGTAFGGTVDAADQDALLRRAHRGELQGPAWGGMPSDLFFKERVLKDATHAYYSHPTAWSVVGWGGPASPRGYVRMGVNRRDPWEAVELKDGGDEAAVRRENSRVG